MPKPYLIVSSADHGTVVSLTLEAVGEGRLARRRTVTGDHRPMRRLLEAWRAAGQPEVEVLDTEAGPAVRLFSAVRLAKTGEIPRLHGNHPRAVAP